MTQFSNNYMNFLKSFNKYYENNYNLFWNDLIENIKTTYPNYDYSNCNILTYDMDNDGIQETKIDYNQNPLAVYFDLNKNGIYEIEYLLNGP